MAAKLAGLHSKSDLRTFVHVGCGEFSARRLYVTTSNNEVGFRDKDRAVCPLCDEPYTMANEVKARHPEDIPILSN